MRVGSDEWCSVVAKLFGVPLESVTVADESVRVGDAAYAIVGGVVLLDEELVKAHTVPATSEDVRRSFSAEWTAYAASQPEHDAEFAAYFDLVDLDMLRGRIVADLGCGSGRWSQRLAPHCRAIVLVDFSDAIFVARDNLESIDNAIFFRGDITRLPFSDKSVDFVFSLGVLHHLEKTALSEARRLMRLTDWALYYLYYALDNRPAYYRPILAAVTVARGQLTRVRSEKARRRVARALAWTVYKPMVAVGEVARRAGVNAPIPLYETYRGKSVNRIEQDAYDRFFTTIEQRVSRRQIAEEFGSGFAVEISPREPYWHFTVTRRHSG